MNSWFFLFVVYEYVLLGSVFLWIDVMMIIEINYKVKNWLFSFFYPFIVVLSFLDGGYRHPRAWFSYWFNGENVGTVILGLFFIDSFKYWF